MSSKGMAKERGKARRERLVILAGGRGTRLAEETSAKPKPMVEVGGKPILWHVMSIYAQHGFTDFMIAAGYKSELIKEYFLNFFLHNSDCVVSLKGGKRRILSSRVPDWTVGVIDTGLDTMTGGRLLRMKERLGGRRFLVTYGDGVGDVNVSALLAFHKKHGKLATVTAVRPPARFGGLVLAGNRVAEFTEKPQTGEGWINGGFFVFEPEVLDYISGDETLLEKDPLESLAADGQLMAFRHDGFWQPMDTLRDKQLLDSLWNSGKAPWRPR